MPNLSRACSKCFKKLHSTSFWSIEISKQRGSTDTWSSTAMHPSLDGSLNSRQRSRIVILPHSGSVRLIKNIVAFKYSSFCKYRARLELQEEQLVRQLLRKLSSSPTAIFWRRYYLTVTKYGFFSRFGRPKPKCIWRVDDSANLATNCTNYTSRSTHIPGWSIAFKPNAVDLK